MTAFPRIESIFARFPLAASVLYVVLIGLFLAIAIGTMLDLMERRSAVAAAADLLAQIENRVPARARAPVESDVTVPAGSPFLEGATVSVAGATLLARVASATTQVGGNLMSSQVELQGPQSKAGFVTATASFEVEPESLQKLLYNLEAGMPFLFVDQMVVQAPAGARDGAGGRLRVLLTVSGQWRDVK
jgi:general secretion pathway protein M